MIMLHSILKLNAFSGYTGALEDGFAGTTAAIGPIALAFYNGMWAYDGWYYILLIFRKSS